MSKHFKYDGMQSNPYGKSFPLFTEVFFSFYDGCMLQAFGTTLSGMTLRRRGWAIPGNEELTKIKRGTILEIKESKTT